MTEHKIEYRSLGELRPYDNNPRDNDAAVKPTAESIRQFGFQSPIIVDKDSVIIAGHTRYKAAKRLHLDKVPVIVASELTPEQVKAYRIADNSTGEVAKWNIDLLTAELAGIKLDMAQFGLDIKLDTNTEVEDDGYEVELPDAPITKPGDLWILGDHRVLCGSATDANDMARLMGETRADLLLTDPPYNVAYEGKTADRLRIQNDQMAESQFRQFLLQFYACAFDACRTGAAAYIFHADTEGEAFRAMFREAGWELHGCLAWVKNTMVLGHSDYQWQHEPCLYGWKPGAAHYFTNSRALTTVIDDAKPADLKHMRKEELLQWALQAQQQLEREPSDVLRFDKPARNAEHPTMKPVPMLGYLIRNSSQVGQTVLDCFGGSGSTLIACEQLSRSCRMMELDPRYVDVIVDRWQKFTGEEAHRA